jgi:hypothetical protein
MVEVTSKKGETKDLCLDFDAIVEAELKDPSYSFIREMDGLDRNLRLSTLDRLTRWIYGGKGWKEFVADGFTIEDLTKVLKGSMEELGFTSGDSAPGE